MVPDDVPSDRDGHDGEPGHSPDDSGFAPDGGSDDHPDTNTFRWHVSRVADRFDDLLPFALVPLFLTVLEFEKVARTLDPSPASFRFSFDFLFPDPLLDLWSFADPPESAGTGTVDVTIETPVETVVLPPEPVGVELAAWIGATLLVYAVIAAVIAAGYLGGIDRRLRGEPATIPECIAAYAPRLFLYYLAIFWAFLALVPLVSIAPPSSLLAVLAAIVLAYLFYAVPFLFVVDDASFVEAFRRSYRFAVSDGAYLRFALWHLGVTAAVSIGLSLAVNAGPAGFLLALVVATPLALVLTAATVSFVRELVERDGGSGRDVASAGPAGTGS